MSDKIEWQKRYTQNGVVLETSSDFATKLSIVTVDKCCKICFNKGNRQVIFNWEDKNFQTYSSKEKHAIWVKIDLQDQPVIVTFFKDEKCEKPFARVTYSV